MCGYKPKQTNKTTSQSRTADGARGPWNLKQAKSCILGETKAFHSSTFIPTSTHAVSATRVGSEVAGRGRHTHTHTPIPYPQLVHRPPTHTPLLNTQWAPGTLPPPPDAIQHDESVLESLRFSTLSSGRVGNGYEMGPREHGSRPHKSVSNHIRLD